VTVSDPTQGQLTNAGDRAVIESLVGVASRSTAFSCCQPVHGECARVLFLQRVRLLPVLRAVCIRRVPHRARGREHVH